MWSNYHTHSHYCDGKGGMQDYLAAAEKAQVAQLGFSSHASLPFACKWCMTKGAFNDYLAEIETAKRSYPGIEVYRGLEVDYIPDVISPSDFASQLDYTIGSVHFVGSYKGKRWEIDNTGDIFQEGLMKIFQGDIRAAITEYFRLTREMIDRFPPSVLGHLDKIKINAGSLFDESEPWYLAEVDSTLKALRQTPIVVEVNTRGLYKKRSDTTYPSPWILERLLYLNIPITFSSDAHHPDDLIREFAETHKMLTDIGFKNVTILKGGMWNKMPLNLYGTGH